MGYSLTAGVLEVKIRGGTTYDIKEMDIVLLMKDYVKNNKELIKKKTEKLKKEAKDNIKNYKPKNLTYLLPPATKDNIYYSDPSYTLKKEIKDNNGNILYPKGFTFNPLHYLTLNKKYVFFNPTIDREVKWIKKNKLDKNLMTTIMITDGRMFDVKKMFKDSIPMFFATDEIIDRFKIKATPSIAFQEGDRIKILEYGLKEWKGGDK